MSKKALYLLGIVVTIILGTFLYLNFCCNCCVKTPVPDAEKKPVAIAQDGNFVPFILSGSGIEYQTHDNLKFLKNSSSLLIPVSDSVSIGLEKLKTLLISNPKQKITITGYAISDETNTSKFENLGLARANDVKNYFVSKGFNASNFDVKGEIMDKWETKSDTILGPVAYQFETAKDSVVSNDEWSTLKEKINSDPLTLHFNTNKASNKLGNIEKQKVADIIKYTKQVKDATVLVVGHSDNVGNRDGNVALGQKRAEFSKKYLSQQGIDASRIITESKGPDEPVGENTTPEGKASNRRTVITIK